MRTLIIGAIVIFLALVVGSKADDEWYPKWRKKYMQKLIDDYEKDGSYE